MMFQQINVTIYVVEMNEWGCRLYGSAGNLLTFVSFCDKNYYLVLGNFESKCIHVSLIIIFVDGMKFRASLPLLFGILIILVLQNKKKKV